MPMSELTSDLRAFDFVVIFRPTLYVFTGGINCLKIVSLLPRKLGLVLQSSDALILHLATEVFPLLHFLR